MDTNVMYSDEIFVPVKGFEGYYEISNYGRLRSLNRTIVRSDGKVKELIGRFIAHDLNSKGYIRNKCTKGAEITRFLVHIIVAKYFVFNPHPDNIIKSIILMEIS